MSFRISVLVDDSDFRQYFSELSQIRIPEFTEKLKRQLGPEAEAIYRNQIPVAQPRPDRPIVGRMRDSVIRLDDKNGFMIVAMDPAARYVAYGTKPHVITARGAKPLYFWWDKIGGYFRGRQVMHPGQRRNPFHARAARLIRLKLHQMAKRLIEEMVRR